MKFSNFSKLLCLGSMLFLLASCSTSKKVDGATVTDASEQSSVKTAGLGQEENLAGAETKGSNSANIGEQTYYFDYDRSDMRSSDKSSLDEQARYLTSHSSAKVLLEGHTDPRGSREYNIGLGDRRSQSIQQALEMAGVNKDQIRTVSYGAEQLASQGHTEQDYQLDRRVHLTYEAK